MGTFLEDIGMKSDLYMAGRWYETSVESGEPKAFVPFVICYARGLGLLETGLLAI